MSIKAMKQALEVLSDERDALSVARYVSRYKHIDDAIDALKQALKQAEKQEAVAVCGMTGVQIIKEGLTTGTLLYTTPPARPADLERLCRIMGTFDLATGHAETMDEALDALEEELRDVLGHYREALKTKPEQDIAYREARRLAEALFKKLYSHEEDYASGRVVWEPLDTTIGIISQIDNMVCNLVREPEQTPIGWMLSKPLIKDACFPVCPKYAPDFDFTIPLYTTPPAREWVGLTDYEVCDLWDKHIVPVYSVNGINPIVFARAIEAYLKEKNT